jgi:predicted lipoprotein with Yx(FWY)xxD motif
MSTKAKKRAVAKREAPKIAGTIVAAAGAALLVTACGSSGSSSSAGAKAGSAKSAAASPHRSGAAMASGSARASASPSGTSAMMAGTTALMTEHTAMGTVLATSQGFTVYRFSKDHGTTSACTGACAVAWPPVTGTPKAASGASLSGKFGTITRSGGVRQATYNGYPLYTFKADTAPGDTRGNDVPSFGGTWYAVTVSPSGMAPPTGPSAASMLPVAPSASKTSGRGGP